MLLLHVTKKLLPLLPNLLLRLLLLRLPLLLPMLCPVLPLLFLERLPRQLLPSALPPMQPRALLKRPRVLPKLSKALLTQ